MDATIINLSAILASIGFRVYLTDSRRRTSDRPYYHLFYIAYDNDDVAHDEGRQRRCAALCHGHVPPHLGSDEVLTSGGRGRNNQRLSTESQSCSLLRAIHRTPKSTQIAAYCQRSSASQAPDRGNRIGKEEQRRARLRAGERGRESDELPTTTHHRQSIDIAAHPDVADADGVGCCGLSESASRQRRCETSPIGGKRVCGR